MADKLITIPIGDGNTLRFPEGTSQEVINAAKTNYAAWKAKGNPSIGAGPETPGPSVSDEGMTAPDVIDEVKGTVGPGRQFRANLPVSTDKQIKRYSDYYPENTPFGVIDGNIVYGDQAGKIHRVTPSVVGGKSVTDVWDRLTRWVAGGTPSTAPQVAGAGAGALVRAPIASGAAAGATAGAVDLARQGLDNYLADEDVTDVNLGNAGAQALEAGLGQYVGNKIAAKASINPLGVNPRDRLAAMDPAKRQAAQDVEAEATRRGITLSGGQATDLPSLKVTERQLSRDPNFMDEMYDFAIKQRETDVPNAVRAEIDEVRGAGPVRRNQPLGNEESVSRFRDAGTAVVRFEEDARSAASAPFRERAFKANDNMSSAKLDMYLATPAGRDALKEAAVRMQNKLTTAGVPDPELLDQAKDLIARGELAPDAIKNGVSSGLKMETLDLIKRSLWDLRQKALSGQTPDKPLARDYDNLRTNLVREMDRLDTTATKKPLSTQMREGAYARYRREFGDASDAVEQLTEGGVGFLNNLKGMDRVQLLDRVFSATNLTAEEMARTRVAFLKAGKHQEFQDGLASYLSHQLDVAMKPPGGAATRGNVPGKLSNALWDGDQKDVLKSALGDPARIESMDKLFQVLRAASRSLPENSATATDLGAPLISDTVGALGKIAGKVVSPAEWTTLGRDALKHYEDNYATPKAREQLMKALLGGQFSRQMAQLRMLSPNSERAMALTGQILAGAAGKGVKTINGPKDRDLAVPSQEE